MGQRGHVKSRELCIFLWKRKRKSQIGNSHFVQHRTVSTVTRVEFVSDRMSYVVLRVCWCNTVVNVHALSEEIIDDSRNNFC